MSSGINNRPLYLFVAGAVIVLGGLIALAKFVNLPGYVPTTSVVNEAPSQPRSVVEVGAANTPSYWILDKTQADVAGRMTLVVIVDSLSTRDQIINLGQLLVREHGKGLSEIEARITFSEEDALRENWYCKTKWGELYEKIRKVYGGDAFAEEHGGVRFWWSSYYLTNRKEYESKSMNETDFIDSATAIVSSSLSLAIKISDAYHGYEAGRMTISEFDRFASVHQELASVLEDRALGLGYPPGRLDKFSKCVIDVAMSVDNMLSEYKSSGSPTDRAQLKENIAADIREFLYYCRKLEDLAQKAGVKLPEPNSAGGL